MLRSRRPKIAVDQVPANSKSKRPHPANWHSRPCVCRGASGEHDSTLKKLEQRNSGSTSQRMRGVGPRNKERFKDHASNSTSGSSDRGGCSPVAGESLHSHAVIHQVNLERRRGHRGGFVAHECFRTLSFTIPDPHWIVANDCEGMPLEKTEAAVKNRNKAVARHLPT